MNAEIFKSKGVCLFGTIFQLVICNRNCKKPAASQYLIIAKNSTVAPAMDTSRASTKLYVIDVFDFFLQRTGVTVAYINCPAGVTTVPIFTNFPQDI